MLHWFGISINPYLNNLLEDVEETYTHLPDGGQVQDNDSTELDAHEDDADLANKFTLLAVDWGA